MRKYISNIQKWGVPTLLITLFLAAASWAYSLDGKFMPRPEIALRFQIAHYQAYQNCVSLEQIKKGMDIPVVEGFCAQVFNAISSQP